MQRLFSDIELSDCDGRNYLVVTHGGTLIQMVRHLLEDFGCEPPQNLESDFLKRKKLNTCISKLILTLKKDGGDGGLTVGGVQYEYVFSVDHLLGPGMEHLKGGCAIPGKI